MYCRSSSRQRSRRGLVRATGYAQNAGSRTQWILSEDGVELGRGHRGEDPSLLECSVVPQLLEAASAHRPRLVMGGLDRDLGGTPRGGRKLLSVDLVNSDAHRNHHAVMRKAMQGVAGQQWQAHLASNILTHVAGGSRRSILCSRALRTKYPPMCDSHATTGAGSDSGTRWSGLVSAFTNDVAMLRLDGAIFAEYPYA